MVNDTIKFFLKPDIQSALRSIKKNVYAKVAPLKAEYAYSREPVPFSEKDSGTFKNISCGTVWSSDCYGCAWFHFTGTVPTVAKGKHVALLISVGGEGCVFDDSGNPVVGTSDIGCFIDFLQPAKGKRLVEVSKSAEGGETVDIWLEAGNNRKPSDFNKCAKLRQAQIVTVRDDVKALYYDYLLLAMQLTSLKSSNEKYKSIQRALKNAIKAAKNYCEEAVAAAREILKSETENGEDSPYTVYATGHAHLDLAWLWPLRETKRKAGRTFANTLKHLEKYPEYIFGVSQPQQLEWVEEMYPEQYAKIKNAVEAGKIECQGGMWVECDTNVTGGESLIRQNIYGKRYWKEKFGKDVNFCWLPDVFGFSGNLPQILKKCGMDYFLTIKLSWNEHNKFPKRTFIWEGIDDSSVLVHMPPEGTYNSDISPWSIKKAIEEYPEKDISDSFGMPFGVGDGGGGPSEAHIELALREKNVKGVPKVVISHAAELFNKLDEKREKYETFKGELYLEKHQGTYTTQGKNKFFNRKIEFLLHNAEALATAAAKFGMEYPRDTLETVWKEVLLYQFHDIIPGSSIKRVYDESVERYEKMCATVTAIINDALNVLSGDKKLSCVNLTGYSSDYRVKYGDKLYETTLTPYGTSVLSEYKPVGQIMANGDVIESDIYVVEFNKKGNIIKLVDKRNGKDYASGGYLNKLNVFRDKRLFYNAWDIDINYTKHKPTEFKLIGSSTHVYDGYCVRENLYSYNRSSITQKITIKEGCPIIDFSSVVDWQETHKMLRAESRPAVFADSVTCDIQMGNIKRSTKNETAIEKAQFEICAHKWIDVSNEGKGFSVITDSKYGWRVKEGLISLNLLRSPMFPAKDADKGTHNIRYAFYPHNGDVYEANTAKVAYIYNNPPIISDREIKLPSIVSSGAGNIVIETVKIAESGQGVIIRAYEDSGKLTTTDITYYQASTECYETDLLENKLNKVELDESGTVIKGIEFKPFEIKTFLII